MKKIVLVALCVVFSVMLFAGCSIGVPVNEYRELLNQYQDIQEDYDLLILERDSLEQELEELEETIDYFMGGLWDEEEPDTTLEVTTNAERVLVDQEGIKITYLGIDTQSSISTDIQLRIENNSNQDITVQTRDVSVNGVGIYGVMSADVDAGKSETDGISFWKLDLEENGITKLESAKFYFNVFREDDYGDIFNSEMIEIVF